MTEWAFDLNVFIEPAFLVSPVNVAVDTKGGFKLHLLHLTSPLPPASGIQGPFCLWQSPAATLCSCLELQRTDTGT